MSNYTEWVARQTRVSFIGVEVVTFLLTAGALADNLFNLGWGYDWNAVFIGLGIMTATSAIYLLCRGVFAAVR